MSIRGFSLALILLSVAASAQSEVGRLESIGLGRSRLRCAMVEKRGVPVRDSGAIEVGKIEFRERWLQKELPKLFPDLDTVDVVDRVLARTGPSGAAATAERLLEIVGPTPAVEAARLVVTRILAEPDRTLQFRLWAAVIRYPVAAIRPAKAKVELLDTKALDQYLQEIASNEAATVFEKGNLELVNGQSAAISVGARISYVRDYKLSQAGDRLFLEPVVDNLKEGLTWTIGAVFDSTSRKLALASEFRFVQVQKPIARFKGKVGLDNQELVIEKPILAETKWSSEGLVCGPGHAGFMVSGLKVRDLNGIAGKNQKAEMILIVRYGVERLSGERLWGKVQGFDRATRLAFVRIKQPADFEVGMKLDFVRDTNKVAKGRVLEIEGQMITVEMDEGEVKAGDQIQ